MINSREPVFVDTSAFIGLIVNSDSVHAAAVAVMKDLNDKKCRLITTEFVLFELANALSSVKHRATAGNFLEQIIRNPAVQVVWSARELFQKSYKLYQDRPDKDWSLTDCAGFVVMDERDTSIAFTTDGHFEQAGFVKLLEN